MSPLAPRVWTGASEFDLTSRAALSRGKVACETEKTAGGEGPLTAPSSGESDLRLHRFASLTRAIAIPNVQEVPTIFAQCTLDSYCFYRAGAGFARILPLRPRLLELSGPRGQNVYEVHLSLTSESGALHQITGFLAESDVEIISMNIQSGRGKTGDVVAYLEMGGSKRGIEEVLEELKGLGSVQEAVAVRKDRVVFEEFLFPIKIDEEARGFLMTDRAWMSIATRLALNYGTGGLAILHQAGIACGEEYAKHLQSKLGLKASQETFVDNLVAMLRAAGMGRVEMSKTEHGFSVRVLEPIVPATETKIHDHFLTGVIAGATGHLFATSYSVDKVRFEGNELEFALEGRRAEALTKVNAVRGPRALAKDDA